ncbi:hypothetical protein L917_21112 [Phytophthora nicotianae]|uniref:Uncharacterized protein n=1 Tax=Phytophthora nicotianae TaxID=4792 RepID=W2FN41_PHYNI|nr:hypothetical protein L915_21395 [Phytophthora nicotianae]ETL24794.1 hypothetical protein L916_21263 [Phytophthora nicotianae]ETL78015.1 hypothetical protein L917_21112 [Phytophthora nicotianae]ETM31280.1 hypothetical protein L914_21126 [Phytophthora nicotianae]
MSLIVLAEVSFAAITAAAITSSTGFKPIPFVVHFGIYRSDDKLLTGILY